MSDFELVSTHEFGLLDYQRVPYRLGPDRLDPRSVVRALHADRDGQRTPRLWWVDATLLPTGQRFVGRFSVAGCAVAGAVATGTAEELVGGSRWSPLHDVVDKDGRPVSQVWRRDDGDVFLPFDVGRVMTSLWSEAYLVLGRRARAATLARRAAVRSYYAVRPLIPRRAQIAVRRKVAKGQRARQYPAWPLESGLHDLIDWATGLVASTTGETIASIAPWPDGKSWALVLTHDVETQEGLRNMELLRGPERRLGLGSSWNFVPERYVVSADTVRGVGADGCEVGVHGLRHDGRDLASRRLVRRRAPRMREYARAWGAEGFRAPATQRGWDLIPQLGFGYDSSYSDTDPYEPQQGGCCSYLPFFNDGTVELPITLPQDHTLFELLGHHDAELWVVKAAELQRRGGMVLVLTHPDYARGPALAAWTQFLEAVSGQPGMWQPLPREMAAWWRDRAVSSLRAQDGHLTVCGPAATRARIQLTRPNGTGDLTQFPDLDVGAS